MPRYPASTPRSAGAIVCQADKTPPYANPIDSVDVSRPLHLIAGHDRRGTTYLWDLGTDKEQRRGKEQRRFSYAGDGDEESVGSIVHFHDQLPLLLMPDENGGLCVVDLVTGERLFAVPDSAWIFDACFHPTEPRLYVGTQNGRQLLGWDLEEKRQCLTVRGEFSGWLDQLSISRDGRFLTVAPSAFDASEGVCTVYSVHSGEVVCQINDDHDSIACAKFSPFEPFLITASCGGRFSIWSIADWKPQATLDSFFATPESVSVSRVTPRAAFAVPNTRTHWRGPTEMSMDPAPGPTVVWDFSCNEIVAVIEPEGNAQCCFDPLLGHLLLADAEGSLRRFELPEPRCPVP